MTSDSFQERFEQCLRLFEREVDKEGRTLSMHALFASDGAHSLSHAFESEDNPTDLRSVSKVVTALVIGALIEDGVEIGDGQLTLDSRVWPLLAPQARRNNDVGFWTDVRLRDLLSNTIGHESGFFFRKDLEGIGDEEYLAYALERPILYPPGTHFSYSNVGPFLVSVMLQEGLHASLKDLADRYVLGPLGISATWREYAGYSAGCTGLAMSNTDLGRLTVLLRDGGRVETTRIVRESWVATMRSMHNRTPSMFDPGRVFPKYAYGMALWVCEDGSYYCDGTDGQYSIVVPSLGLAIATTGSQPDMKPITRCLVPLVGSRPAMG
jgi:CubicO group peptidase (beta-lactamase class C family)